MTATETEAWQSFMHWLALTVFGGIAVCVGFVFTVDPYGLYRVFDRPGINAIKPQPSRHINEIKLTQARRLAPSAIILGNSRAEIGLDPQSPALVDKGYSAYNLAIRGTSIANARMQLEYLWREKNRPKLVLLGLEFLDFVNARHARQTSTPPVPLDIEGWFWRFDSLFSMASLKDSLSTLLIQSDEEADIVTARGFNPLRPYRGLARQEGYFALFQQRAVENAATYLRKAGGTLEGGEFADFRRISALSAESGGELVMIIYPYHSQILALFEETGLWPLFEEWKKRVVAEMGAARLEHPNLRVRLLDFSGYGPRQCEKIPPKGDLKQSVQWYWEAGHFKSGLGDAVLASALSAAPADSKAAFGMPLEKTSLELNSQRIAEERAECAANYPQLFADAKTIVLAQRSRAGAPPAAH